MTKINSANWRSTGDIGAKALAGACLLLLACGGEAPAAPGTKTGPTTTPPASGAAGGGATGAAAAGKPATPPTTGGAAGMTASAAAGKPATTPATGTAGMSASGTAGSSAAAGSGPMMATGGTSAATGGSSAGGSSAATGGTSGNPEGGPNTSNNKCLEGITDYGKDGPFKYMMKTSGQVKMLVPMVDAGCKVPVVHLANGTGASCSSYQPALNRMASHGFLTICYEDPNTGAGDQGVKAFDTAMKEYPDLADNKLGSTGHSQGGQAAFTVLALAEKKFGDQFTYAGLAMEPASGFGTQPTGTSWQALYKTIKSPMFMFSAVGSDGLVPQSWVMDAYNALSDSVEKVFWAKQGATHIPVPNGEEQEISIPWFRWKLLGDKAACEYFKKIPMTIMGWQEVASKNVKPCE